MNRSPSSPPSPPVLLELGTWCAMLGLLAAVGFAAMDVFADLVEAMARPILQGHAQP